MMTFQLCIADDTYALQQHDMLQQSSNVLISAKKKCRTVGANVGEALIAKSQAWRNLRLRRWTSANAKLHPTIKMEAFSSHPDATSMRSLAEDIVKGQFKIPVDRMVALDDAEL